MNQESKTLLDQFARALSNECIYGEGDSLSMKRWRELGAKTAAARAALEEHIAQLESVAQATTASASDGDTLCFGASRPGEMCPCRACAEWRTQVAKTMGRAAAPSREAAPLTERLRDALVIYAESYELMDRMKPGNKVDCVSVAYDIRKNMVDSVLAALAQQGASQDAAANAGGKQPVAPQNVSDERKEFDAYWSGLDDAGATEAELEMCEYAAWQAWQARPRRCIALPLSAYPAGTTYKAPATSAGASQGQAGADEQPTIPCCGDEACNFCERVPVKAATTAKSPSSAKAGAERGEA